MCRHVQLIVQKYTKLKAYLHRSKIKSNNIQTQAQQTASYSTAMHFLNFRTGINALSLPSNTRKKESCAHILAKRIPSNDDLLQTPNSMVAFLSF